MDKEIVLALLLLAAAVFVLSQALIVPTFGSDARARKLLRRKLDELDTEQAQEEIQSLVRQKYLQQLSPLERRLEQLPMMESLDRFISQAGRSMLAHRLVGFALLLGVAAGAVALALSGNFAIAGLALAAGLVAPFAVIYHERSVRLQRFEEQLPDAVDIMKRALRAGHPFSACLKLVADDMDDPVAGEFQLAFADVNFGNDLRRALLAMVFRVPSTNLMAIVTAVLIQKETGGNLAEVFDRISSVIRGRFKFGRKVRTLSAEGRLSAWILALVPIVLFALLWTMSPDYLPPLLSNPVGRKLVAFACLMVLLGVIWMRKIIRVDF